MKRQRTNEPPPPMQRKPCGDCEAGILRSETPTPVDTEKPHVAIIGGGLGGLALATACRHRGIPHTVYERDGSFQQRSQGYGLTMQQAAKALKGFGIEDLQEGITSTKHIVHTPDGQVVAEWGLRKWGRSSEKQPPRRQNVHIARQALRHDLYRMVDEANILWNHKLIDLSENSDGPVKLTFQVNDQIVNTTADLVVGADGIRSRVREYLVQNAPLRYLDCIVILGICPLSSVTVESDLLDGETVFQTADGTTRIYMMPFSKTEYMWQLSFPMSEEEASQLSGDGPSSLHQEAVKRCQDWHTPVAEILQATPVDLISGYPVYDRVLLSLSDLNRSSRVTLIGDACHPMSPFKGQGANQALLDALSLAHCIYQNKPLPEFHEEMLERSAKKVKASAEAAEFLHTPVAIEPGNVTRGGAFRKL